MGRRRWKLGVISATAVLSLMPGWPVRAGNGKRNRAGQEDAESGRRPDQHPAAEQRQFWHRSAQPYAERVERSAGGSDQPEQRVERHYPHRHADHQAARRPDDRRQHVGARIHYSHGISFSGQCGNEIHLGCRAGDSDSNHHGQSARVEALGRGTVGRGLVHSRGHGSSARSPTRFGPLPATTTVPTSANS